MKKTFITVIALLNLIFFTNLVASPSNAAACPKGYKVKTDILMTTIDMSSDGSAEPTLTGTWKGAWCSNGKTVKNAVISYKGQGYDYTVGNTYFSRILDKSWSSEFGGVKMLSATYSLKSCSMSGNTCYLLRPEEPIGTFDLGFSPIGYFVNEFGIKFGSTYVIG